MMDRIKKYLQYQFHHPNYFFFMMSLILLIAVPPFSTFLESGSLVNITLGGVIAMAVFYTTSNYREFVLHGVLGIVLFSLIVFNRTQSPFIFINPVLMMIFFSLAFKNIIHHIFHVKQIGLNEVYASIAGYLILGIMAAPFFFLIEQTIPQSFTHLENSEFYDFIYFSYITLTTVGFGDISPIHPLAKSITILIGIFGQLYLTILVAIIIGKYLAYEELNK